MSDRPATPNPGRAMWGFVEAFVSGGMLVALWMMPQWLWGGEVHITGGHRLSRAFIEQAAGLPSGHALYRIDPEAIRARLRAVPAIEDVRVRRWLFPARLDLTVRERSARAVVANQPQPTYLDSFGESYSLPGGGAAGEAPAIVAELATASLTMEERTALRALFAAWPRGGRGTLDLRDPASWSASIDGIRVGLGAPSDLPQKLTVFSHLVPLARRAGKTIQYVDLRFPEAPTIRTSEATR